MSTPRLVAAAVTLLGICACLPACANSTSAPSPSSSPASPSSPSAPAFPTYTLVGVVTDAARHSGIAGARVEVINSSGKAALTDNAGVYTIAGLGGGTYRVRASSNGYDSRELVFDMFQDGRADFQLPSPVVTSANYGGVWTGIYDVSDCRDIDVPGLNPLHLCPSRTQYFRFTLTQVGTLVSGSYTLESAFYSCACGVLGYGEFPLSGSISPDGTLAATAIGSVRFTGVTGKLDLNLLQPSSTTIAGTGTLHLRFGTTDDRTIASVAIRTGTRTQ